MAGEKTASFAVKIKDEGSSAANTQADALERLRSKIVGGQKALGEMQAAMRRLQGGSSTNVAAFRDLKAKIDAQKNAIADAQAKYLDLGGSLENLKKKSRGTGDAFSKFRGTASQMPGPLGSITAKLSSMGELLVGGGPIAVGILAIVAAMTALTVAAVAAGAALLQYGIGQGLTTMRNYMGIAAGKASVLQEAIDSVSGTVSIGRSQVEGYAAGLYRAGMRGENLRQSLQAVATTAAVQGDAHAHMIAGLAVGYARTGRNVTDLANRIQGRLGGIAAAQMLDLDVQTQKLHESFAQLFSGLRIEGLLSAINSITSLFSQSTASGRALHAMIDALFNPLLNSANGAQPVIKRFFQGMIIGALHLTILFLRVKNSLVSAFAHSPFAKFFHGLDAGSASLQAGAIVVGAFAAAVLLSVGAVVLLVAAAASLAAPFVAFGLAMKWAFDKVVAAYTWISSHSWGDLGRLLLRGLVDGLKADAALLLSAVRGIADSAKHALMGALGIHSPSRVFAELGVQVPRGFAQGVESGAGEVGASVGSMVSGAYDMPEAPTGGASSTSHTTSVSIGDVHVHAQTNDAAGLAEAFKEKVSELFEGAALTVARPTP
jgi:hypothetical protein